ncbi:MAG: hypothetical protein KUG72_01240 [Pseudomonadales bacterium]|nr:hypothetical protein [Pseudomonadales bacterium]
MTTRLRKTILSCLLLCFASQSLAAQDFVFQLLGSAPDMVTCHSNEPVLFSDKNQPHQNSARVPVQSDCCSTDCDMGSCFTALFPTYSAFYSPLFPVPETTYVAQLPDQQATSLLRPPIRI